MASSPRFVSVEDEGPESPPEYITRYGNVGISSFFLDKKILILLKQMFREELSKDDIRAELQPHIIDVLEVLSKSDPHTTDTEWNIFYRLKLVVAFSIKMVQAEYAFSTINHELIHEVTDGTSQTASNLIRSALQDFTAETLTSLDRSFLKGVINELTAIAIANYHDSESKVLLPSSLEADLKGNVDASYLWINNSEHALRTAVQVKSGYHVHSRKDPSSPSRIIYVYGKDFGNGGRTDLGFQTSVRLANSYRASEIDPRDDRHFQGLGVSLRKIIGDDTQAINISDPVKRRLARKTE